MVIQKPFWTLIALIFLIRAMIPVGFMPDFSGAHAIEICSGTDLKTVMVDDNGKPVSSDHQKSVDGGCSFSFLSSAFIGSAVPVSLNEPVLYTLAQSPDVQERLTKLFSVSPQSRGPPAFVL